jgi:vacuolar protein sorting-associated protein 13A/C
MLEGIVYRILKKVLGEFVEGLDKKNLRVSVWSGRLVLKCVLLNKSLLQKAGLPFEMISGIISSLEVAL